MLRSIYRSIGGLRIMIYLIVTMISILEFSLVYQLAKSVGVKITLGHLVGCILCGAVITGGVFSLFLL